MNVLDLLWCVVSFSAAHFDFHMLPKCFGSFDFNTVFILAHSNGRTNYPRLLVFDCVFSDNNKIGSPDQKCLTILHETHHKSYTLWWKRQKSRVT